MQFTRLRLSGFKSFVDPTELIIEPGLTGVVGPNGCGKSNLLEAIRWVMGENRAKSLRGSGMEDVIFAGTGRRSPRHMAEVTLVLDNDSRSAPPPFADEAMLEVTRRIERDSGSAYRINGDDVRQKDVQLLFADAATGAHSPALVSQGRIGMLINAKPQDRRQVLEEAAGISGLHARRKEAESRLRSAESNLARLQDVIQAMANQSSNLKRQAKQAARYREITTDLEQAEASLLFLRWQEAAELVIERERALREAQKAVAEAGEASATASKEQAEVAATIAPLRDTMVAAGAALQRIRLEGESRAAEKARRAETIDRLENTLADIARDLSREEEAGKDADEALERLGGEEKRLAAASNNSGAERDAARLALDDAARAASRSEKAFDAVAEQAASARARRASLESDLLAIRRRLEQVTLDLKRREDERAAIAADPKLDEELTALADAMAGLDARILTAAQEKTDAEKALEDGRKTLEENRKALTEAEGALGALSGEVGALKKLLASSETKGGRSILDQVTANPGFEDALGSALAGVSEAGLSDSMDRFFTDMKSLDSPEIPPGTVPLWDQVTVPDALERMIRFTFVAESDADTTALMDALHPGMRVVTKEGGLWRWDGFITKPGAPSRATQRLKDINRLTALEGDLADAQALASRKRQEVSDGEELHQGARQAEYASRETLRGLEREGNEARRRLMTLEQEKARRESKVTGLSESIIRLGEEREAAQERVAGVEAEVGALPDISALEQELDGLRSAVGSKRQALAAARAAYDSLEREEEARTARLAEVGRDLEAWQTRRDKSSTQRAVLSERQTDTEKQSAALITDPEREKAEDLALAEKLADAEAAQQAASDAVAAAERGQQSKDAAVRAANEALAKVREHEIRAEAGLEAQIERRKDISVQIAERFQCPPTHVLERVGLTSDQLAGDLGTIEATLEKLKRERDRLGAVNLRAEEELSEIVEQVEHLESERADLVEAINRLRGAISSLNREGRERLLAAFEIVNGHFGELFTTLFGGGEAHLELTESDDPLDAGLEIFASPPGKKLQALSLLSGGEQALTALSLIFAVFVTNPAPICVLDEVDAPLDDANVERFCNLLMNMTERTDTRFLIVTHNAVTMSRVNRLFGVTMAERGVSTLVSVDLERAEALLEN